MAPGPKLSAFANSGRINSTMSDAASDTTVTAAKKQHVPFQESHQVKCTKPDCEKLFETVKDMKRHKKSDPEHFYCKRCDVDCEDWEDLTRHKVEMMEPYVTGKITPSEHDMPKHIVCEFCGEDFGSFGGRKLHRKQMHPADQEVYCPGPNCGELFIRAGNMVAHIESGHCPGISRNELYTRINQKYISKQIMKAPDKFNGMSQPYEQPPPPAPPTAELTDGFETQDQESGGVQLNLLDEQDEAQMGGYKPLKAETNLIDVDPRPAHQGAWPRLPGQPDKLTASMRSMSIGSSSKAGSAATSRRGGRKVLSGSVAHSGFEEDNASSAANSTGGKHKAWSKSNTSEALFPGAKSTSSGDWESVYSQIEEETRAASNNNILSAHWWDPTSTEYSVKLFLNAVGTYSCPFPECIQDNTVYYAAADIEEHIRLAHLRHHFQCPTCFKRFDKAASLVAHAETTTKCPIRQASGFNQLISEITGGLLTAESKSVPKVYKMENAVVKPGQAKGGIMDTKFSGTRPDW